MTAASLRAGTPADLLTLVPYLLGFHPAESLVLVWLRGRRVVLTARVDVVACADPAALASSLARMRRQSGADRAVLVGYSDSEERCEGMPAVADVVAGVAEVVDVLWVGGGSWRSLRRPEECGRAPGGRLPQDSVMAAEAVFAGLVALPDRAAATRAVTPHPTARLGADVMAHAIATVSGLSFDARCALAVAHLSCLAGPAPAARVCAELAVLVADPRIRDAVLQRLDERSAPAFIDAWSRVCRVTPDRYGAAPACILALAAWVSGNGVLQLACVDRARACGGSEPLADLVEQLVIQAMPPARWQAIRAQLAPLPRAG